MQKLLIDIYIILGIYFFIGGIGIVLINRKKGDAFEKRSRWVKYWVYLILVALVIHTIWFGYFLILSIVLSVIGFYEIFKVNKLKKGFFYLLPFAIFLLIAILFVLAYKLDRPFLLYIYLFVLVFDGFSQIIGQLFGKSKISPKVSPNKTKEGFLGGIIAVVITLFIFSGLKFDLSTIFINLFSSMFIALIAFGGDILASYFKRLNDVKDYSNLIPEHGGVLDRFDSFIFTTAVINLVFIIFSQI